MTLQALCKSQTQLTPADIQVLEEVARQLPLMAEWTASDVFIDCMTGDGQAIVAAHARPVSAGSAYEKDVVGQYAQREKEPAVFRAMEIGMPVRDLKAVTQENRNVRQDVAPILNGEGKCVGVTISYVSLFRKYHHWSRCCRLILCRTVRKAGQTSHHF